MDCSVTPPQLLGNMGEHHSLGAGEISRRPRLLPKLRRCRLTNAYFEPASSRTADLEGIRETSAGRVKPIPGPGRKQHRAVWASEHRSHVYGSTAIGSRRESDRNGVQSP